MAQEERPRPELSKKEVRQYQRKLKKLNKSLQKKTSKLRKFLEEQGVKVPSANLNLPSDSLSMPTMQVPDSLKGNFAQYQDKLKEKAVMPDSLSVPTFEEGVSYAKEKLNIDDKASELESQVGDKKGQLEQLKGKKPTIEELGNLTPMGDEIALLKKKLEVGKRFAKTDPKTALRVEESLLELTDLEYDLKDLEELKSRFKNFQFDSSMVKKYIEPLTGDVTKLKSQVGEYQSMLDGYKGRLKDWDKTLEAEIMKLEEVQGLAEIVPKKPIDPATKAEKAKQTLDKGYQSTDYVTGLIKERFSKLIEEKGPGIISERLRDGHEKMADLKEKYSSLEDSANKPKRPPNPLKEKSFSQRLVFGGNLQVNRQKPLTLDAGAEIAYQITPKSEWGVGGAYRLKLEKGERPETVTDLLNVRSFYHYRIWRSIGLQANYELNYALPRTEQVMDTLTKRWEESALIGIRNEQPFVKKLGGYVSLQYDVLHKSDSPNPKWLFRFGFRLK